MNSIKNNSNNDYSYYYRENVQMPNSENDRKCHSCQCQSKGEVELANRIQLVLAELKICVDHCHRIMTNYEYQKNYSNSSELTTDYDWSDNHMKSKVLHQMQKDYDENKRLLDDISYTCSSDEEDDDEMKEMSHREIKRKRTVISAETKSNQRNVSSVKSSSIISTLLEIAINILRKT
ncbi:hypothetical protein SNEBB_003307 [Seison nebaliae]|nr:hypothetical protein SNEBB_003307 [Seison nebaliae]